MNETHVTMIGNAVEDPVIRFGKNGNQFVTFRLASNVRRRDPNTGLYVDAGTNYVTVLAFRQLASNVAESVRKGQPVLVSGRLRISQWTSGERSGTSVEIDATSLGHDLSRGQASFNKTKTAGHVGGGSFPADVAGASLRVAEAPDPEIPEPTAPYDESGGYEDAPAYDDVAGGPLPAYEETREEPYGVTRERIGA